MTWFLDLRAQRSGGGVAADVTVYKDDVQVSAADLKEAVENCDVVLATHGFNVNRDSGRRSLSFWEQWLTLSHTSVYIAVLWPGDSAWLPALDYPIEGNEAISSGNLLATFVVNNLLGAASLSFASHSLGARVVLQAIRGIGPSSRIKSLLLMAGAIDDTCLSAEYSDAAQAVDRISVLSSYHDEVLKLAFPIGNFFSGVVTRGSPYWHAALGREGPGATLAGRVQQGWQIPNAWEYGHHHYLATVGPTDPPFPLPQSVPALGSPIPGGATFDEWRTAWSAAILSTRFSS